MSRLQKILIGLGVVVFGCCGLFSLALIFVPETEPESGEEVVVQSLVENELDASEEDTPEPTVESLPTEEQEPINTPQPTDDVPLANTSTVTPEPTNTTEPTNTPKPTNTTEPTNTPKPTNTAVPTDIPVPQIEIDSTTSVNLRSGPGTNYDSVGSLQSGDVVEVIGRTNDGAWYNVVLLDGSYAWVSASLASKETTNQLENVPISATVPAPPVVEIAPTQPPPEPTEPAQEPTSLPAPTTPPEPTAPPVIASSQIIITAVNKSAEYVDIQNIGNAPQDLNGWLLRSEKGSQDCFLSGSIDAGQVLRIWARSEDAGQGGFNCGFGGNIWNNSEPDAAILFNSSGEQVARW